MLRVCKLPILITALFLMVNSVTFANERYRPVRDKVVIKECGACHMAFQPQMLPKRSWEKIMTGLSDHFGEDASSDVKTKEKITSYLLKNAADSG